MTRERKITRRIEKFPHIETSSSDPLVGTYFPIMAFKEIRLPRGYAEWKLRFKRKRRKAGG
jgi:hypothetical protein